MVIVGRISLGCSVFLNKLKKTQIYLKKPAIRLTITNYIINSGNAFPLGKLVDVKSLNKKDSFRK
jgi:hypothetical protein